MTPGEDERAEHEDAILSRPFHGTLFNKLMAPAKPPDDTAPPSDTEHIITLVTHDEPPNAEELKRWRALSGDTSVRGWWNAAVPRLIDALCTAQAERDAAQRELAQARERVVDIRDNYDHSPSFDHDVGTGRFCGPCGAARLLAAQPEEVGKLDAEDNEWMNAPMGEYQS